MKRVRAADLKVGDRIHPYDWTPHPAKYEVIETVNISVQIIHRHVDELCEDGGCEGCGGGEVDYLDIDGNKLVTVFEDSDD